MEFIIRSIAIASFVVIAWLIVIASFQLKFLFSPGMSILRWIDFNSRYLSRHDSQRVVQLS